jgi:hypothetical protein
MVNIIENWSIIKVTFLKKKANLKLANFMQYSFKLTHADELEGFPNLAKADEGKKILVNIPLQMVDKVEQKIAKNDSIIVRKAFGQEYFIKN